MYLTFWRFFVILLLWEIKEGVEGTHLRLPLFHLLFSALQTVPGTGPEGRYPLTKRSCNAISRVSVARLSTSLDDYQPPDNPGPRPFRSPELQLVLHVVY